MDLVEQILEKKQEEYTIDIENQIDQLVYQFYELTDKEIKIMERNGENHSKIYCSPYIVQGLNHGLCGIYD